MATYTFESITATQALAFSAAADSLAFANPASSGNEISVAYNSSGAPSGPTVTLTDLTNGRSVVFGTTAGGTGILGEAGQGSSQIPFADGSNLFIGGTATDSAAGTALGDGLFGGAGDDSLSGGAGRDLLQGNQGDDVLDGGPGADTIFGGQGNDIIVAGAGTNLVNGNLGDDTISGVAGSANTLLGGQQNDSLAGGGGADFLNGNLGDDTISGGGAADTIFGEGGSDRITAGDGGAAADGGSDNDTITGGPGGDTITGGSGTDVLRGGDGPDRFVFASGHSGTAEGLLDRILDWSGGRSGAPADQFHFLGIAGATPTTYLELTVSTYAAAKVLADSQIAAGNNFVAVQIGADVVLFVDTGANNGTAEDAVVLVGRTLADIDYTNIVA